MVEDLDVQVEVQPQKKHVQFADQPVTVVYEINERKSYNRRKRLFRALYLLGSRKSSQEEVEEVSAECETVEINSPKPILKKRSVYRDNAFGYEDLISNAADVDISEWKSSCTTYPDICVDSSDADRNENERSMLMRAKSNNKVPRDMDSNFANYTQGSSTSIKRHGKHRISFKARKRSVNVLLSKAGLVKTKPYESETLEDNCKESSISDRNPHLLVEQENVSHKSKTFPMKMPSFSAGKKLTLLRRSSSDAGLRKSNSNTIENGCSRLSCILHLPERVRKHTFDTFENHTDIVSVV